MAFVPPAAGRPLAATARPHNRTPLHSTFPTGRPPLPRRAHATAPPAPQAILSEGTQAPAFSATDSDGSPLALSDFAAAGQSVVLYFSAGMGGGCTSQSRAFRDAAAELSALGATIVAVSAQGKGASAAFKRSNDLPFPVVPDDKRELQKLFDIPATMGVIPGRVTYVIDPQGVLRKAYNSQFDFKSHVAVCKEVLGKMG